MALARARIAIGGVVRNRAWILQEHLSALAAIEYDDKEFLFLENDSTDATPTIIANFLIHSGIPGEMQCYQTKCPHWDRGEYGIDKYANLADVRNRFIDAFLRTDADFLLSVDSDIIVPPNIATALLAASVATDDRPAIVAAAISNVPDKPLDGFIAGNFLVEHDNLIEHPPAYPLQGVHEMAVVGAVYLIPRQVLEDGARYAADAQGEDVPFCRAARELGYTISVNLDVICDHQMTRRRSE